MTVYRLFPYDESAAPNERGGALFVPPGGRNRIDNPRSYSVLYVAANPEAAIAETFGRLAVWTPETFLHGSGRSYALAAYEIPDDLAIFNLDDVDALKTIGICAPPTSSRATALRHRRGRKRSLISVHMKARVGGATTGPTGLSSAFGITAQCVSGNSAYGHVVERSRPSDGGGDRAPNSAVAAATVHVLRVDVALLARHVVVRCDLATLEKTPSNASFERPLPGARVKIAARIVRSHSSAI